MITDKNVAAFVDWVKRTRMTGTKVTVRNGEVRADIREIAMDVSCEMHQKDSTDHGWQAASNGVMMNDDKGRHFFDMSFAAEDDWFVECTIADAFKAAA